jgi:nuclear transport factor 2 (NTF2) superfamily protein
MLNIIMKKLVPPFTKKTAIAKVQAAEDAWNSKDPERVSLAYTIDSQWRTTLYIKKILMVIHR